MLEEYPDSLGKKNLTGVLSAVHHFQTRAHVKAPSSLVQPMSAREMCHIEETIRNFNNNICVNNVLSGHGGSCWEWF